MKLLINGMWTIAVGQWRCDRSPPIVTCSIVRDSNHVDEAEPIVVYITNINKEIAFCTLSEDAVIASMNNAKSQP